jgi:hypothetical protein
VQTRILRDLDFVVKACGERVRIVGCACRGTSGVMQSFKTREPFASVQTVVHEEPPYMTISMTRYRRP